MRERGRSTIGIATLAIAASAPWTCVRAATGDGTADWLPWLILGAVAVFVVGVLLRMFLAARFPKGYRVWARSRRDDFAQRNEAWDRADEEFRK